MNQEKAMFLERDTPFEVVRNLLIGPDYGFLQKLASQKPERQREPDFVLILSMVLLWWL
jgi:hypothetical protein